GVEAGRRAGRVEEAGLSKDEKRALRDAPVPGRRLGGGDLVQGPPDVEGARAAGLFGEPRDGAGQGPVQLEGARAVAEAREAAAVALGQPGAGEREELAWRDVAQHRASGRELVQRADGHARADLAAERPEQ